MSRLVIDLATCADCGECTAACSYPYHGANSGVARLRELVGQELICRRCELRSCVEACPRDALEADAEGVLTRHTMRCTGCLSCSHACPFGTIVPAALQFRGSVCDYCAGREGLLPACATTCPLNAIAVQDVSAGQPGLHLLGEHLAVRSPVWQKAEAGRTR